MKLIIRTILIGSLFLSYSSYANIPLSCQQHYASHWMDYSDPNISTQSLSFAGTEGDDKNGTVKTFVRSVDGRISYDGFLATCTKLEDGSLQFKLVIDNRVSLNLITTDGTTLNVLPPSFMPLERWRPGESEVGEVKGPFVLTG
jgi:hypothetical protein